MSEENLSEDSVEQTPEPIQAESAFPLTPRMIAIAKGEDPDAITSEADDAEVSDDQAADAAPEQEEASDAGEVAEEPKEWFTAADKNRAVAYGLDPEDLAAYSSREEFGRALRLIDKATSRLAPAAPKAEAQEAPAEEEAVDDTKPTDASGKINLAYFEKNFDEGTVEAMKALRAQQDTVEKIAQDNESFRQQQEQAIWQTHVNEFHRAAEELNPEFFGRTVDKSGLPVQMSQAELDRRQKLWGAANLISEHMTREQQAQGLPPSVPPWPIVLKQAAVLAFGDELAKHQKAAEKQSKVQQYQNIARQSKTRRPVASTASTHSAYRGAPPADPHSTQAIMQHPDVEAVLRKFQDR